MANIKGIIVEIGGDTSKLQDALKKVNSSTASLSKELKGINSLLKLDPKNTELVAQKQTVLKENIEETSKKLEELKKAQQMADETIANGGEISQENYRNLQREIINTQNKLNNLQVEASNWTKAGRSIEEFGNKVTNISDKIDKMGTTLTTRLTLPIVGIATLLTKSAMEQESAVQQIDNIYGKASKTIKDFAENTAISYNMSTKEAYKYSQVFGNLIQSITDDEKENAQYTQELLKASAVIASSTGRTMEDVMDRIRSGLLGNTEAIEDLGVNVNVALLESTDAFKQFAGDKSWNELDFQTQQQIRLFGILEQTTKKYGDEVKQNTTSDIQQLTAKFNNMTNKLSNNLLPIANKLIDVADKGIDKLDDLSDEEIKNITNIVLFTASIGPAIKILGTLSKTVGSGIKTIGSFSQAISLMGKTSTEGFKNASSGTQNLTKALNSLTSPVGLAITSIGALAAAYTFLKYEADKLPAQLQKITEETEKAKKSHEEYRNELNETASSSLAEIKNTEDLRNELSKLVDENGKVKDGYKDRVAFILNELNNALGTEYSLTGDVISQYKTLQDEIDLLILKKKAQIILENEEGKYTTAIQNKNEAYQKLIDSQNEYNNALKGKTYEEFFEDLKQNYMEAGYTAEKSAEHAKDWMSKWIDGYKEAYETNKGIYEDYINDISNWENDYSIIQSNNTEKIKEMVNARINSYGKENSTREEQIKSGIQQELYNIQELKKLREEDLKNQDEISAQAHANSIESGKKRLQSLVENLAAQTSIINENSPEVINAWKALADGSYEYYSETVSGMPLEMQQKIQEITGVIAGGTPQMQAQAEELGRKTVEEFDKSADARIKALNTITGYLQGLSDEEKRELLKQAGIENVDIVLDELNKGNLSEENGKNILIGLWTGLKNNTWQGKILGVASGLAQAVNKAFTGKSGWDIHSPSKKMQEFTEYYMQPISDVIKKRQKGIVATASNLANSVNSVFNNKLNIPQIQDLGKLQGSLSNQIMESTKMIYTTPNIVFNVQELDENKLQQCFNYINKKFGTQY